jgi:hypothetical protein
MQACAYNLLPILMLHLIAGLPLLAYYVVHASTVQYSPGKRFLQ